MARQRNGPGAAPQAGGRPHGLRGKAVVPAGGACAAAPGRGGIPDG